MRLTMPEIILALDDDLEKPPGNQGGGPGGSCNYESFLEYARWYRSLTPRQRLDRLRGN